MVSFFFVLIILFALALISNATPFFGASYTLIATTELVAIGFDLESFALVVVVTALGATLGKIACTPVRGVSASRCRGTRT